MSNSRETELSNFSQSGYPSTSPSVPEVYSIDAYPRPANNPSFSAPSPPDIVQSSSAVPSVPSVPAYNFHDGYSASYASTVPSYPAYNPYVQGGNGYPSNPNMAPSTNVGGSYPYGAVGGQVQTGTTAPGQLQTPSPYMMAQPVMTQMQPVGQPRPVMAMPAPQVAVKTTKTTPAKAQSGCPKCCRGFCATFWILAILAGIGCGVYFGLGLGDPSTAHYNEPWNISFPLRGLSLMTQDDLDDENIAVPLASMFQFFGSYHTAYVSSNSYITFSYGSDAFNGLSASYPSGPKIMIQGADNSLQRLYYSRRESGTGIRFEGTSSTSGVIGWPNMVWEVLFLSNGDLYIYIEQLDRTTGQVGISNGMYYVRTFSTMPGNVTKFTREQLENTGTNTGTPGRTSNFPLSGPSTTLESGSQDDSYTSVSLSSSFQIAGRSYSTAYVGSNSYITFQSGSTAYRDLSASSPQGPKIMIQGCDNSVQRIRKYTLSTGTGIRFEGTAATTGTLDMPNMVWEVLFENEGGLRIYVEQMQRTGCQVGISNGNTYIGTFETTPGSETYFSEYQLG